VQASGLIAPLTEIADWIAGHTEEMPLTHRPKPS
jgi:hypothetical protein